jgi:FSR family fosmidomycin resistance protein-like MFS transporter
MAVLVALIFSKYIYLASITSFYVFYLMQRFDLSTRDAQICQFIFFAAVAAGTLIGGPVGDRIGRKTVIWVSILGVLPFTLALPWVGLAATIGLSIVIGLVLSSAFPAIVVYAQELLPGRVGMVSGLFFGLIFGVGGIAAALLGGLADRMGIGFVYRICSFLPAIGLLAALLPDLGGRVRTTTGCLRRALAQSEMDPDVENM